MDLQFTPQEEAFRAEVQTFLKEKLPKHISLKIKAGQRLSKADQDEWHAILNERGWYANHWPQEHGGPGWGAVEKFIFDTECALAGGPRIVPFGVNMLGPVLIKYGNEQQKKYWLPRILSGQDWWCQGYSEPGAGSDLASVKTTAVRDGDFYIVNGQKTWTTQGQHANMIFCLVRTNREAKAQAGISFLLVDMNSPGVELRPIRTLDGDKEVNLENMKTTNLRVIAAVAGGGVPGAESSMLKIRGTEIRQEILSLIRRAMGVYAVPYIDEAQYEGYDQAPVGGIDEAATASANYFNYRKLSIFGGSNEIQKNIISKMILGL